MRVHSVLNAIFIAGTIATPVHQLKRDVTVTVSGTTATSYPQPAYVIPGFPIHSSCNGTERNQLEKALGDTIKIAQQAANHIYTHGNESELYVKYFGQAPTAEVIGWYEKVVYGSREGILFRCDDIDGNCHQEGWGGHWRGENATMETVICPLSYQTRQAIEALCGDGFTVANGALNYYFASDLLHRLYHVASIGEGAAEHYADSYAECLALAEENPAEAVRNSHTLQYFALDVYAFDVALPGEGCTGKVQESEISSITPKASSITSSVGVQSSGAPVFSSVPVPTSTSASSNTAKATTQSASRTSSAVAECHTHAGGEVHCV